MYVALVKLWNTLIGRASHYLSQSRKFDAIPVCRFYTSVLLDSLVMDTYFYLSSQASSFFSSHANQCKLSALRLHSFLHFSRFVESSRMHKHRSLPLNLRGTLLHLNFSSVLTFQKFYLTTLTTLHCLVSRFKKKKKKGIPGALIKRRFHNTTSFTCCSDTSKTNCFQTCKDFFCQFNFSRLRLLITTLPSFCLFKCVS